MPDLREVRCYTDPVVHRTTSPPGGDVVTVCGEHYGRMRLHDGAYVRRWRANTPQEITDCVTCFAPEGVTVTDPAQPVIYRCDVAIHAGRDVHAHSRQGRERFTTAGVASLTPQEARRRYAVERQLGPDGQQLLFHDTDWTIDYTPPTDAHLTVGPGAEHLTVEPTPEPVIYQCHAGHHPLLSGVHHHSRYVNSNVDWDVVRDQGQPTLLYTGADGSAPPGGFERDTAPDGTQYRFSVNDYTTTSRPPRNESVTPTQQESSAMPDITTAISVGDFVTAANMRPTNLNGDHVFLVVGVHPTPYIITTVVATDGTSGAPMSDYLNRIDDNVRPHLPATTRCWNFPIDRVVRANPNLPVPAEMEGLRDLILGGSSREAAEPVDLYPLNYDKMRERRHQTVTLHSRPGVRQGNDLVFGCQTWPISVVADNAGTVQFGPGTEVRVTMPARIEDGDYLFIGDRRRSFTDVNDYCERVIADAPPLTPVLNAVVMEHGYYGCSAHPGEIIHIRPDHNGRIAIGRVRLNREGVPTGNIAQEDGFLGIHADCRPVQGSTTERIMQFARTSHYALVPFHDRQRDHFTNGRWTLGTLMEGTHTPVECNEAGAVAVPEPF